MASTRPLGVLQPDPLRCRRKVEVLDQQACRGAYGRTGKVREVLRDFERGETFKQQLKDDPFPTLRSAGRPDAAAEPLLRELGAPDDVLQRATLDVLPSYRRCSGCSRCSRRRRGWRRDSSVAVAAVAAGTSPVRPAAIPRGASDFPRPTQPF